MNNQLKSEAKRITKSHKRRQAWHRIVRSLAMIVVFCTTYALILPAITMHSDTICGLDSHVHSESCYETHAVTALSCTHSENENHEDACWADTGETITELTCAMTEHTHSDECYPVEPEATLGIEFRCGWAEHNHADTCFDSEGTQICTLSQHIHEAGCVLDLVDMTADMESSADWEQMAGGLELSGNWAEDLLAMAKSQIGYGESQSNCVLVGGELMGYTRYGDWYGNPYMSWDAPFAAFCLHYAGIPETVIPRYSDPDQWYDMLAQLNLLRDTSDGMPKPGDLVFCLGPDGNRTVAVVQNADASGGNLDSLGYRVIAGDVNNRVDTFVVTMDKIEGVCDLEAAQSSHEGLNEVLSDEPVITVTEPEATEPETTEPEATEPETTEPEATEPEATAAVYTVETENYIVTVSCPPGLILPQGAELRAVEYAKDSETYRQRCQEAGYELEWLMNIGFFLGDEELMLSGAFDVVVTSKQGDAMGQDITHFAGSGTERINGSTEEDASVSFQSDGFSDFGGGIALAAAAGYQFKTVNPSELQSGVNYVIYVVKNNNIIFLSSNGYETAAITGQFSNEAITIGSVWSRTEAQMGNANSANFTWQVARNGNNTYLVCQNNQRRLTLSNGWANLSDSGSSLTISRNGNGANVGTNADGRSYHLRYEDGWRASWYNNQGQLATYADTVYFAQIGAGTAEPDGNYPHAVHTGEVHINRLRFYNLCENGDDGISALAGCVFEVTGDNGYKTTIVSGNEPELNLPEDIPDGTYTITEISAPEGYLRDTEFERTFVISDGMLSSDRTIGTFINHNYEQLAAGKNAEVEDYANRIYQINLSANSNMRLYEMEPIDVLFVVDQSNSMLFPAVLQPTGKYVTLRLNGDGNVNSIESLNLDKSRMHYIIADPTGTSTVWAVWHDGTAWMCQDASYYAKAKHGNEPGYQDDNETVIFPSNLSYADQKNSEGEGVRSNGGALGKSLVGGTLGADIDKENGDVKSYMVYTTDDEYNRLHYLEEALANITYQLADVNDQNRVSLTRFTKVVNTNDCYGPLNLTPDNTEYMVDLVSSIKTSGGTRQDIALKHVYQEHLNDSGEHFDKGVDHTFTMLITDGAPVGTSSEPVGDYRDQATTTGNTIYGQIKGWAGLVRNKSTLMTVGLGMENVVGGKEVLQEIATSEEYYCALDDAEELMEFVQKLLFETFRPKEKIEIHGDIVDEISDSFYPIAWVGLGEGNTTGNQMLLTDGAKDWVLLEQGDWITLNGRLTSEGAADAAGQLLRKEDGTFYVKWTNQNLSDSAWNGSFYVKAKEDFVGGNAIDTNKSAAVTVKGTEKPLETPTVNVRLLDLNEMHSEVTVYLGDQVNGEGDAPQDSLRYFYENTRFTKLIADDGAVLNQVEIAGADGLEKAVFYLRYALGQDLTEEQWSELLNGNTVEIPYTYDDDSSHGAVGSFTFRLSKEGHGSLYGVHTAISDCQPNGKPATENCSEPAETYTLTVAYRAYRLGENGRPSGNVHNGSAGPGTEVGTGAILQNGYGTITKQNVHRVHVISGTIEIIKYYTEGVTDGIDRTFYFSLYRQENGGNTLVSGPHPITIPANQSQGSASLHFDHLPRGTYTVIESEDPDYAPETVAVLATTNCYSVPAAGESLTSQSHELLFVMGNNTANENVIGKSEGDRYTSYIDPVNGVYGAAAFTNAPIVYTAEIPVEKIWVETTQDHQGDEIYVALYLNDTLVLDADGNARVLRLDAASEWKGIFTVALADENDSLENYHYSVREVSQIRMGAVPDWHSAVLENDGETIVYYEKTLNAGEIIAVGGNGYRVEYGTGGEGQLIVTNSLAVTLPNTGGRGTQMYTTSGILLIGIALVFGCSRRRRYGRRAHG